MRNEAVYSKFYHNILVLFHINMYITYNIYSYNIQLKILHSISCTEMNTLSESFKLNITTEFYQFFCRQLLNVLHSLQYLYSRQF